MSVRQGLLSDVAAISAIYRSHIGQWHIRNAAGELEAADYEALTLFERWQHGGPWLAVETCAVWLGHLLERGEGIPIVAEHAGEVLGYAEVFVGREPEPYGFHLNISTLAVHQAAGGQGLGRAMVGYIEDMGRALGCQRVTAAYPVPEEFFAHLGFVPFMERQRVVLAAEEGRVFYKAHDLSNAHPDQRGGWFMPLGRFQNSREEWERMFWGIWRGVPELVEARWHCLTIDLTGQPGILHLHQLDNDPHSATARLWTKNRPSSHIVAAIKDRAARLGYTRLQTIVDAPLAELVNEALHTSPAQTLYAKPLNSELP
ncbi:MAG: N-acetyltransferase family protein [Anaerolineales bacterium]